MKRILAMATALIFSLFAFETDVFAAEPVTLTPPYFTGTWTGTSWEFTIPYSGYYKLTLAGSSGGTYKSTGGNGVVLTTKNSVYLSKGQKLSGDAGVVPSYDLTGTKMVVHGGNSTNLYIDDTLYLKAAGGNATTVSPMDAAVDDLHLCRGNDESEVTPIVHWHQDLNHTGITLGTTFQYTVYSMTDPTGCYVGAGHNHNVIFACPNHQERCDGYIYFDGANSTTKTWCPDYPGASSGGYQRLPASQSTQCTHCGYSEKRDGDIYGRWECPNHVLKWDCGSPTNTWQCRCGYAQGQVLSSLDGIANSYDPSSVCNSAISNQGSGYFTIQLAEQGAIYMSNQQVQRLAYLNRFYNVVVLDGRVTYCKYGNLN